MVDDKYAIFGNYLWNEINKAPFGTLSKRELEIAILRNAIDAGLLEMPSPAGLATDLRLSVTRAHGYLNDLALRQPSLSDKEALGKLIELLPDIEVIPDNLFLHIPLNDHPLRIWLERRLSAANLMHGESLRRDVVKLTPRGLLRLFNDSKDILTPAQSLKILGRKLPNTPWIDEAKKKWTSGVHWLDVASKVVDATSLVTNLLPLLRVACGSGF